MTVQNRTPAIQYAEIRKRTQAKVECRFKVVTRRGGGLSADAGFA